MDHIDTRILRALQRDSNRPVADLSSDLGLSPSACHRRIKALETAGVIRGYSADLSRRKLGFNILVFVEITLRSQERSVLEGFEAAVAYAVAGEMGFAEDQVVSLDRQTQ